jgi:hypothetical protein
MASPSQQLPPGWTAEWYQACQLIFCTFIDEKLAGILLVRDISSSVRDMHELWH